MPPLAWSYSLSRSSWQRSFPRHCLIFPKSARHADKLTYDSYRYRVGRALLLGLEILVAADIIRTVVLEPTLTNVLVLGLLVLIRTFLSWALILEIEGR